MTNTQRQGNKPVPPAQQIRQRRERQFEGLDEYHYRVDPRTGWRFCLSSRTTPSSSSSHWEQHDRIKARILGEPHPGLNSIFCSEMSFRLLEIKSLGKRRGVQTGTPAARHIFSCTDVAQLARQCVYSHITHTCGSRLEYIFVSHEKFTLYPLRAMSHTVQYSTPCTGTLSPPFPVPRSLKHCHDLRPLQRGTSTELPSLTNWIDFFAWKRIFFQGSSGVGSVILRKKIGDLVSSGCFPQ